MGILETSQLALWIHYFSTRKRADWENTSNDKYVQHSRKATLWLIIRHPESQADMGPEKCIKNLFILILLPVPRTMSCDGNTNWLMQSLKKLQCCPSLGVSVQAKSPMVPILPYCSTSTFALPQTDTILQWMTLASCWEIKIFCCCCLHTSSEAAAGTLNRNDDEWYGPDLWPTEITGQNPLFKWSTFQFALCTPAQYLYIWAY